LPAFESLGAIRTMLLAEQVEPRRLVDVFLPIA
jgi:hypothetical protein